MPGLHCDLCNVEAGILLDLNSVELSCVESFWNSAECTNYCTTRRLVGSCPKPSSRACAVEPDEMPAGPTNHRIEDHGWYLFNERPVIANTIPEGVQAVRQDAFVAQQNRMELHECAFRNAPWSMESLSLGKASETRISA